MTIVIDERETVREIFDNLNPRIYSKEFKCYECGQWVEEDDTVWIDPKTKKATTEGVPYHVSCAPGELEDDSDL